MMRFISLFSIFWVLFFIGCGSGSSTHAAGAKTDAGTLQTRSLLSRITKGNYIDVARFAYNRRNVANASDYRYDVPIPGTTPAHGSKMLPYTVTFDQKDHAIKSMVLKNYNTEIRVRFLRDGNVNIVMQMPGYVTSETVSYEQFVGSKES